MTDEEKLAVFLAGFAVKMTIFAAAVRDYVTKGRSDWPSREYSTAIRAAEQIPQPTRTLPITIVFDNLDATLRQSFGVSIHVELPKESAPASLAFIQVTDLASGRKFPDG